MDSVTLLPLLSVHLCPDGLMDFLQQLLETVLTLLSLLCVQLCLDGLADLLQQLLETVLTLLSPLVCAALP